MRFLIALIIILVFVAAAWLLAIKPSGRKHEITEKYMDRPYAHRGLYDLSISVPENSLAAFDRAAERGYGMELDVRLTADNKLVILHDDNARRMTGKDVLISDITEEEACALRLRGTRHRIPRFSEMLETVDGRVPLLIELKTVKTKDKDTCDRLCKLVCDALKDYKGPYMLESFDPRVLWWLRSHHPEIARGQLVTFYRKYGDKKSPIADFVLGNSLLNFLTLPDFIAVHFDDSESTSIKLSRMLYKTKEFEWTINTPEKQACCEQRGAVPIFEQYEPTSGEEN